MKKPKYITLFIDTYSEINLLSDAQAGRLIKELLRYAESGSKSDISDDIAVSLMFSMLQRQIDREFKNYEELCGKRKKAAQARHHKDANGCNCIQEEDKDEDKHDDNNKNGRADDRDALSAHQDRTSPAGDIADVSEVVGYLNRQTGASFRPTAKSTVSRIKALLDEGYTLRDLKRVIDNKCREWKGTQYAKYLRPETLFGERFDSYLHAPLSQPSQRTGSKKLSVYDAEPYLSSLNPQALKPLFDD